MQTNRPLNRHGLPIVEPRRTRVIKVSVWDGFTPSGQPQYRTAFTVEPFLYK